jgi:hypothetical protein
VKNIKGLPQRRGDTEGTEKGREGYGKVSRGGAEDAEKGRVVRSCCLILSARDGFYMRKFLKKIRIFEGIKYIINGSN